MDRRPSPRTIAKSLGLDTRTVKSRMKAMEQEGFIKYYQAIPNYSALGYRASTYLLPFSNPGAKKDAIAKLKLLDDVTRIDEYLNSAAFTLLHKPGNDLQKKLSIVKELVKGGVPDGVEPLMLYDIDFPKTRFRPSLTDWLIVKSLRYDALKPEPEVAKEIGASLPTVRKRLKKLVEDKLVFIVPIFDGRMVSNLVLYALLFIPDSARDETLLERLTETFKDDSYYRITSPSGAIIFLMYAKRMMDAEQNYIKAQRLPGVRRVLMDFAGETHDCSGSIDALIAERASSSPG
jgi:DNA-binding Lrp family transcriptional regulator